MNSDAIWAEAKRIALIAPAVIAAYIGGMTAISVVVDVMGWNAGGDMIINFANLAAGYLMLVALIDQTDLSPEGRTNNLWTYFGLGIIVGLCTVVGLFLLVIPGIILLVRWAPAYGYAMAGNRSVTEAVSDSWHATKGHFFPIFVAMLVPVAIMAVSLGIYMFSLDDFGGVSVMGSIVGNFGIYAGSATSTVVGLAIYSLLALPQHGLAEVFG